MAHRIRFCRYCQPGSITHSFYHFPRLTGRGGGTGVLIRNDFENVKTINRSSSTFECLELQIIHSGKKLFMYVIYRPPQSSIANFIVDFEELLINSETRGCKTIYVGDFNIWVDDEESNDAKLFRDVLKPFQLNNFIDRPTFLSGHTLDLVISNENSLLLENIDVESVPTISDHMLVSFQLTLSKICKEFKIIKFRLNNDLLGSKLVQEFKHLFVPQNMVCSCSEISICVHCLNFIARNISRRVFDETCPLVEKKIRLQDESLKWFNSEVREAKKQMRKAEKKYKTHKTEQYQNEFKRLRQIKCNKVRNAKSKHYVEKIGKCSSDKELYNEMLSLLGKNKNSNILPFSTDKLDVANKFKDFFIVKIDRIVMSFETCSITEEIYSIPDFPLEMLKVFPPTTPEEVLKIMKNMKKSFCKSDPIDVRKINMESHGLQLAEIYSDLINHSFHCGEFPEAEKFAHVRPLIKKGGDPDELSSYRPLYQTSFLSKLHEKCALKHIVNYFERFDCIPQFQSAYKSFHSVETALCRVQNDLIQSKARGECSILIMLDLSAAFDSIDRGQLLSDLHDLGITGKAHNWLATYLTSRKFSVCIGDETSDEGEMKYGVPQGTILGPVLFIVYTLSLRYLLEPYGVSYHLYADDTQIYFKITDKEDVADKLRDLGSAVQKWMERRKLKLNSSKTEIMIVGSQARLSNLNFGDKITFLNTDVSLSSKVRNLGVIMDSSLSLRDQLINVKRKSIGNLINIAHIADFLDQSSRMKLVHGLVFSQIDFCNSLYYNLPNVDLHSLQMLINSAARVVTGMPCFSQERITPVCMRLHFLPVRARIEYKICLLVFKALNCGQPSYLKDLLVPHRTDSAMSLRSLDTDRLQEPFLSRAVVVDRCFEHCAPRLYNALPTEIKSQDNVSGFKKKLKTHLFRKSYDNTDLCLNPLYHV